MASNIAVVPVFSGMAHFQDHRHRPSLGERTVLPDSAARPQPGPRARNDKRQQDQGQDSGSASPPTGNSSSTFDAALMAGTLPPDPGTRDELIRRIGSTDVSEQSEARLKDFLA